MPGRLPDFVVIGAPRSGTTTLNSYLREHPSIFMAPGKELRFFDQRWERGVDWYRSCFDGVAGESRAGEATPSYMSNEVALERLDDVLPGADLIAILREPTSRANSDYHHAVARGLETRSLRDALQAELQGDDSPRYVGRGRYGAQLRAVESLSGRHRLLVLWHEDLAQRPRHVLDSVADFLGVPAWPRIDGRIVNGQDRFRSVRLRRLMHQAPPIAKSIVGRLNRVEVDLPPMPEDLRALVLTALEPDIRDLSAQTGRNLDEWTA